MSRIKNFYHDELEARRAAEDGMTTEATEMERRVAAAIVGEMARQMRQTDGPLDQFAVARAAIAAHKDPA